MHELNHAIALYVGWDLNAFPKEDAMRVLGHFGNVRGAELAERANALLEELGKIEPDWEKNDLVTASKLAVEVLASRHPTLNDEGKAALEWAYSWWWK